MSSNASPWIFERETGRSYYHWQDVDGRTWLKYSDESEPKIAAYTNQPSIANRTYETPRSGPSSSQSQKLYSNSQRDKQYYDAGGHEARYTSGVDQSTRGYSGTIYRDSGPASWTQAQGAYAPDPLADSIRKLTVTEYDDSYKTASSAFSQTKEGGYSTQYQPLPTTGSVAHSAVYENQPQAEQWHSVPQAYGERSRYQDKGKLVDPSSRRYIAGTGGQKEELDSSYRVRNTDWKTFFKVGRVFSTLWTEGTSARETDPNGTFLSNITIVAYKEKVHSKIRRFVVVREGDRCCSCLPVTTYDGRGYKKKGINLTEHGQIYAKSQPKAISGISRTPLRIKLSPGGRIDERLSLVHYGKVYTVETNVKVKDVGDLDSESRKLLRRYWKEVFVDNDDDIEDPLPEPFSTQVDSLVGVGDSHTVPTYGEPASYSNNASDDTPRNTYTESADSRWGSTSTYSRQAPVENFEYSQQSRDFQYDYNGGYSTADNSTSSYTQQLPNIDDDSHPVKYNNDEVMIENDQEDITLPTPQEILKEENDRKQRKSTTSGKQAHEKHHRRKDDRRR